MSISCVYLCGYEIKIRYHQTECAKIGSKKMKYSEKFCTKHDKLLEIQIKVLEKINLINIYQKNTKYNLRSKKYCFVCC